MYLRNLQNPVSDITPMLFMTPPTIALSHLSGRQLRSLELEGRGLAALGQGGVFRWRVGS